jgi:hypothetical protein
MFWLDTAMMRSLDPSFQVAENEMDHGQMRLSFVGVAAERQRLMAVSNLGKAGVASPAIGTQDGAARNIVFDKADKRVRTSVWHHTKPQPSRIDAALVLLAIVAARANLYSTDHNRFVMNSSTFAARLPADHAFINLDRMLTTDSIALRANHASAEFVEDLESRLVARKSKLALELDGGLSGDLCCHEIRPPKPRRERRMARLHDGSGRQRRIGFAATATQHYRRTGSETVRLAHNAALRTYEPTRPTNGFKVASASRVIGETR